MYVTNLSYIHIYIHIKCVYIYTWWIYMYVNALYRKFSEAERNASSEVCVRVCKVVCACVWERVCCGRVCDSICVGVWRVNVGMCVCWDTTELPPPPPHAPGVPEMLCVCMSLKKEKSTEAYM